uniref:LPP20 family lipoprotein n=1 Tax=Ancylomarina sp. TaxID=1970196 RepID=UPI003567A946
SYAGRRPPKWVKNRPVSSGYYIGVSVVSKNVDNYMQLAKNKALQDLASQISINISSNSVLYQFEDNTSFKEEFESQVKTSLVQELEAYEFVASWNNKRGNEYWEYYRLSKKQYALLQRLKLNKAKRLAQNYFDEATMYEDKLDLIQALSYYVKSIKALKKHLDQDLSVMTFEGPINLGTEIFKRIQNIYTRTQLVPVNKNIKIEISTSIKDPFMVKASWASDEGEKELVNLPLNFDFVTGGGLLDKHANTDEFGYASSQLTRVTSKEKLQKVEAALDLSSILNQDDEDYEIYKMFLTPELAPKCSIILNVERLKAYMLFSEKIFGKDSQRSILKSAIKKELSENFFSFTEDKNSANVILDVKTNVTKGEIKEGRNYKVHIVYLDCFFSLTDMKSGFEIFNDAIYEVKGMKPVSYNYAVREAYEQAVEEIHNTIIPKLNQLDL